MKYLKTYEDTTRDDLQIDDYIYVDHSLNDCIYRYKLPGTEKSLGELQLEPYCKIKLINNKKIMINESLLWDYLVECYNFKQNKFYSDYINKKAIIRKLTPIEIQNFKLKEDLLKYNL